MDMSRLLTETGTVLWWTLVGVVAFIAGAWLFDKLDPIDYRAQIEKGNIAAAIKMSAVLLGLAGIIIMVIR
jgi:uncharacterized membrane protein YjfL (UPF0719 family)